MNQTNYGLKATAGGSDFFVYFALANSVRDLKHSAYGTIFDTVTTKHVCLYVHRAAGTMLPPSCFEQQVRP